MGLIPSAVWGDNSFRAATTYPATRRSFCATLPGLSQATAEFSSRWQNRERHCFYTKIVLSRQPGLTSSCGVSAWSSVHIVGCAPRTNQ